MNTFEQYLLKLAAVAVMAAPLCAQTGERRATLAGGDGNGAGKCTIEVSVDGSAEVEIRGDRGILRTTSGRPAQWRRFQCSGPMPSDPAEFRFSGVDGRGRQELIQDPSRGRGAAIVRIQDPDGGAEGYTFDLVWRAAGFVPSPAGPSVETRDREPSRYDPARACHEAVRELASRQYGLRDIDFRNSTNEDRDRADPMAGSFDVPQGNRRDSYTFSCKLDREGAVREANIAREHVEAQAPRYSEPRREGPADRYPGGYDPTAACQRAVQQQILQSGYRNVQFGSLTSDLRRDGWFAGTATARRNNNGRSYDFDIGCSVNQDSGDIRSVQANRR